LHAQLTLESPQRRIGVVGPVTPSRARQAILKEHSDDGKHCQSTVSQLRIELLLSNLWVCNARIHEADGPQSKETGPVVARLVINLFIVDIEFYDASEADDLQPPQCWDFGERRQSVGNFRELDV